jgi:hypothetical protein
MKTKFILLTAVLTLLSFTSDNNLKDYLNVKTITFNEKVYDLKWSAKNDNYYIQEYLTDNDSLPDFNEMVSIFVLNENLSIADAVAVKINELNEAKKTDPVCNYAITRNSDDKTILIDFLRGEAEGDYNTIVEFNLYRYKQVKIGKNKNAILVLVFSKRAYSYKITPFLKSLGEMRLELIGKMFQVEMPEIKLIN